MQDSVKNFHKILEEWVEGFSNFFYKILYDLKPRGGKILHTWSSASANLAPSLRLYYSVRDFILYSLFYYYIILLLLYRKISIDGPGGIHFLSTHNFWITHKRIKIKTYSERVETFLSEHAFIIVLWQVVHKSCVEKMWIPPGLSIEYLRYFLFLF